MLQKEFIDVTLVAGGSVWGSLEQSGREDERGDSTSFWPCTARTSQIYQPIIQIHCSAVWPRWIVRDGMPRGPFLTFLLPFLMSSETSLQELLLTSPPPPLEVATLRPSSGVHACRAPP